MYFIKNDDEFWACFREARSNFLSIYNSFSRFVISIYNLGNIQWQKRPNHMALSIRSNLGGGNIKGGKDDDKERVKMKFELRTYRKLMQSYIIMGRTICSLKLPRTNHFYSIRNTKAVSNLTHIFRDMWKYFLDFESLSIAIVKILRASSVLGWEHYPGRKVLG